jgi:hypothetical protein
VSETSKYMAIPRRPLALAERIRKDGWCQEFTSLVIGEVPKTKRVPIDLQEFAGCTPVVLDGVSDWWDEQGATRWPSESLEPSYRLPWPAVWAEWEDRNERVNRYGVEFVRKGFLLRDHQKPAGVSNLKWARSITNPLVLNTIVGPSKPEFDRMAGIVTVRHFTESPWLPLVSTLPAIAVPYASDGSGILSQELRKADSLGAFYFAGASTGGEQLLAQGVWEEFGMWRLFSALLSVKGLGVTDVDLARQVRRRVERQAIKDGGPPPFIKYKTLTLSLPAPSGKPSQEGGGPASPIPFHLVRGHLADYRTGKGLFGKFRTVVWVPMHTRGHQKVGVVAKSYDARVDQQGASQNA